MSSPTINFGVLSIPYQTLDVAGPVDILNSFSTDNWLECELPKHLLPKTLPIKFHYIGLDRSPVKHTANYHSVPTTTVATCPKLDYLLIGGPLPSWISTEMQEEWKAFIRARVPEVKRVFTTCTGGMVLAESGVLDGIEATTNHEGLDLAREMWPKVKWVKEQWVGDGKFWTAGGAVAGMDMFGDWVSKDFDAEVVGMGFRGLDFLPRESYGKGKVVIH